MRVRGVGGLQLCNPHAMATRARPAPRPPASAKSDGTLLNEPGAAFALTICPREEEGSCQ